MHSSQLSRIEAGIKQLNDDLKRREQEQLDRIEAMLAEAIGLMRSSQTDPAELAALAERLNAQSKELEKANEPPA